MAELVESQFKGLWLGIAQGPYQGWNNEIVPPNPPLIPTGKDPTGKGLTHLMGVKHIDHICLVVPVIGNQSDTGGAPKPTPNSSVIVYKGQQWQPVSDNDAMKYGARWVYVQADIHPEDLPYGIFRQTGLYYGLQPKPEYANNTNTAINEAYTPNQLQKNTGYLMAYDNQRIQGYYSNTALEESIVIEA